MHYRLIGIGTVQGRTAPIPVRETLVPETFRPLEYKGTQDPSGRNAVPLRQQVRRCSGSCRFAIPLPKAKQREPTKIDADLHSGAGMQVSLSDQKSRPSVMPKLRGIR